MAMFGVWQSPSGPKLVLEKQVEGFLACRKCRGYGQSGNPLCGAIYICENCKGSGERF